MRIVRHEPFADAGRQREADRLGMAIFLASEAMLFGALIAGLLALRTFEPAAFTAASQRLDLFAGGVNTAVLLTSSLLVAISVEASGCNRNRLAAAMLLATAALGLVFLAIKGSEYHAEYLKGLMPGAGARESFHSAGERMFMDGYFIATGLHAFHVIIGIAMLAGCGWRFLGDSPPSKVGLENVGLYWHLVDIVWIFLFPILYLSR